MPEQERDEAAELKARAEGSKQEAETLLKRYRHELLVPSNMLGILTVYLLFIATVVGFGTIAFYSGHLITLKIIFFICIPLLLVVPIGTAWYLRILLPRKPTERGARSKQKLLDRITQSFISKSLVQLGNNRNFRLYTLASYTAMIVVAIRSFPAHPRFSVTLVVFYLALSFASVISWVSETIQREIYAEIYERILKVLEIIEGVRNTGISALRIAERSLDFIEGTEKSHDEAHRTLVEAVKAIDHTTRVLANRADDPPPKVDAPSQEAATSENDDVL